MDGDMNGIEEYENVYSKESKPATVEILPIFKMISLKIQMTGSCMIGQFITKCIIKILF